MRKERVRKRRRRGLEKERAGEKEGYERRGIDSHYRITVSILLLCLPGSVQNGPRVSVSLAG